MKYYMTSNAGRALTVGGKPLTFEAFEYFPPSMTWWGSYATADEDEIAELDVLAIKGTISAATEEDYVKSEVKKKKAYVSPSIVELRHWHSPSPDGNRAVAAPAAMVNPVEVVTDILLPKPATRSGISRT